MLNNNHQPIKNPVSHPFFPASKASAAYLGQLGFIHRAIGDDAHIPTMDCNHQPTGRKLMKMKTLQMMVFLVITKLRGDNIGIFTGFSWFFW
jgi:hypothetical protein